MKNLTDIVNEAHSGFTEMETWFFSQKPNTKDVFNDFVKWYNQQRNKLNKGEIGQVLNTALRLIDEGDLRPMK